MGFLLDENFSKGLARHLARPGHDAMRAIEADLRGATDEELLLFAKPQGRSVRRSRGVAVRGTTGSLCGVRERTRGRSLLLVFEKGEAE